MTEKCPVCKNNIKTTDKACSACGFTDLHREFITKEDGELWIKQVVEPFREQYENSKRNIDTPSENSNRKYNERGLDASGYDAEGYNDKGFNKQGIHRNGSKFDRDGYDNTGYDEKGFNRQGIHRNGTSYDKSGYNKNGYNKDGYDKSGYNKYGFDKNGVHKNGTKYDSYGCDVNGHRRQTTSTSQTYNSQNSNYAHQTSKENENNGGGMPIGFFLIMLVVGILWLILSYATVGSDGFLFMGFPGIIMAFCGFMGMVTKE